MCEAAHFHSVYLFAPSSREADLRIKFLAVFVISALELLALSGFADAGTVVYSDFFAFNIAADGFDALTPVANCGAPCLIGENPASFAGLISLSTTPGSNVNFTSANFYQTPLGVTYPNGFLTESFNPLANTLTINLPSAVTAFGLNYGTFNSTPISFTLNNGFNGTDPAPPSLGSLRFGGAISTDPFSQITLSVAAGDSFIISQLFVGDGEGTDKFANLEVSDVPELSTWAMMILGFAGIGFVAYRRKTNQKLAISAA
jgi:hypothetical protein